MQQAIKYVFSCKYSLQMQIFDLENEFEHWNCNCFTGDDGSGDEPQQGILVKESESHYSLWCSGRVNCEGLLVELKVSKAGFSEQCISHIYKIVEECASFLL